MKPAQWSTASAPLQRSLSVSGQGAPSLAAASAQWSSFSGLPGQSSIVVYFTLPRCSFCYTFPQQKFSHCISRSLSLCSWLQKGEYYIIRLFNFCIYNLIQLFSKQTISAEHAHTGSSALTSSTLPTSVLLTSALPTLTSSSDTWVVDMNAKRRHLTVFNRLDYRRTGSVQGTVVSGELIKSGLTPQTLSRIWELADITKTGALSADEFCLAMYLVCRAELTRHAILAMGYGQIFWEL